MKTEKHKQISLTRFKILERFSLMFVLNRTQRTQKKKRKNEYLKDKQLYKIKIV